jgi:hypothetical protein
MSTRAIDRIESIGSEAETHGTVVALSESPLPAGLLWAGTDDGRIHVTPDDGRTWSDVTPTEVSGHYVAKLEASHHDADTAYAAIDGHRNDVMKPLVLMTANRGRTWTNITGDLPEKWPVKVVREDRFNPNVLYAGTENAIYITIDRGASWTRLNAESLPTVAIDDIAQHPRERDLIAGTHGRSIWVLDDASALSQLTPEIVAAEAHLFTPATARPRLILPYGGLSSNRLFAAANPPVGVQLAYWLRDYTGEEVSITITSSAGHTVRKLTGAHRPGINRIVWDLLPEEHDRFRNPEARYGQKPFVPAGQYTATLTCGKRKSLCKFEVLPAPGEAGNK